MSLIESQQIVHSTFGPEHLVMPAPEAPKVTIDGRVEQYIRVRDAIKEIEEKHKKELKDYRETLEMLNHWLLTYLSTNKAESVKTKQGTVYASTRYTASLADPDAFMKFVIDKGLWELMDRRANAVAVRDYVQENSGLPPGVNLNSTTTAGVRRAP